MADAEVGDDVWGEDPTIKRLEAAVAERLGHEAALYVPSGTMGNQICLRLAAPPGTEVLANEDNHILWYEAAAAPVLSGVQLHPVAGPRGVLDPAAARQPRQLVEHGGRAALVGRGRRLAWFTVGWNALEGLVAIVSGLVAGSIALLAFGADSYVEVFAGVVVLWRLAAERPDLQIELTQTISDEELFVLLADGQLDLTFAMLPIPAGPFVAVELFGDPFVLMTAPGSTLSRTIWNSSS